MKQLITRGHLSLFLILFLIFIGLEFEVEMWLSSSMADLPLQDTFLLLLAPALYCGLIFAFILYYGQQLELKQSSMVLILFISFVSVGFPIAYSNDFVDQLINQKFSGALAENLIAIMGALIEESIKLFFVYLIIQSFNRRDFGFILITGCLVGLGFQWTEDISYIFSSKEVGECFVNMLSRFSGAFSSHWVYTGITSFGFYLVMNHKKKAYLYLSAPVILHALWNSTLNGGKFVSALLSVVTLVLFMECIQSGRKELTMQEHSMTL